MIVEKQLDTLDNKVVKVNKKPTPKSDNPNLTRMFFSSLFVGAKNSGKTYGLVKMLKNYETSPIRDNEGNKLPIREILICPTANSDANPIYKSLKNLDEDDIILSYSEAALHEKLASIEKDKQDIIDYNAYVKAWKKFAINEDMSVLTPEELIILSKYDFSPLQYVPKPRYKFQPVVFLILDDLIGDNTVFKRGNCLVANLTIKHRHLGINLIFTTQNPKSINNIIRNNIDIWVLYKFSNASMVLEKIYPEVSSFLTEQEFEEAYLHAVREPHNALIVDTHPQTDRDKRLRKNFDIVLEIH
jgi:hypothetical protein